MYTRRRFLKRSALIAGAGLVPASVLTRLIPLRTYIMPEKLTRSTFSNALNTRFQLLVDATSRVDVELVEIEHKQAQERHTGGEHFALLFQGPESRPLDQKMYRFEHDEIGSFDLFIVPVGMDEKGRYYEAVFNRLA